MSAQMVEDDDISNQPMAGPLRGFHKRSLTLPSSFLGSTYGTSRGFGVMQPVEEEPADSPHDTDPPAQAHPQSYRHDAAQLSLELEYVKRIHQQDKQFFYQEIAHLRHQISTLEQCLQEQEAHHEFQRNEFYGLQMRHNATVAEHNEIVAKHKALGAELDQKGSEYRDALDVLEAVDRHAVDIASDDSSMGHTQSDGLSTKPEVAMDRKASQNSDLGRYRTLPKRIAAMKYRIVGSEERFQQAYAAWSNEHKHQRKLSTARIQALGEDLRRVMENSQRLSRENGKLEMALEGSKRKLASAKKEVASLKQALRHAQVFPSVEDKMSTEEAVQLVKTLNIHIHDVSKVLSRSLKHVPDKSKAREGTAKAISLLGEEVVMELPDGVLNGGEAKDGTGYQELWKTLLRVALTNWSARCIRSWDLSLEDSGQVANILAIVHKRMQIVEDPITVAKWRSLTRAQIRTSSNRWMESLTSNMADLLSFLELNYTVPHSVVEKHFQLIVASTRAVREAIGELVISKNLDVVAGSPEASSGSPRTKRASISQDAVPEDVILATCGMGLKNDSNQFLLPPLTFRKTTLLNIISRI